MNVKTNVRQEGSLQTTTPSFVNPWAARGSVQPKTLGKEKSHEREDQSQGRKALLKPQHDRPLVPLARASARARSCTKGE